MNNYQNLRKNHSTHALSIILVILMLLEICSLAVLFSRLTVWVPAENENIFPLTESTQLTTVKVGTVDKDGALHFYEQASIQGDNFTSGIITANTNSAAAEIIKLDSQAPFNPVVDNSTNPGLEISGSDKVWEGNTDVEFFKISYENGEGKISVESAKGDNVIAPGTSNKYSFTLKNTSDVSLDYKMTMDAYVTGTDIKLPIVVRVYNHDGEFSLGDEENWSDVLDLNSVLEQGTLAKDRYANFTLEWMWPFEGDDQLDTLLGSNPDSKDISLTINVNTLAQQSDDPNDPGDNPPQTGDSTVMNVVWALFAVVIAVVAIFCGRKFKNREDLYE